MNVVYFNVFGVIGEKKVIGIVDDDNKKKVVSSIAKYINKYYQVSNIINDDENNVRIVWSDGDRVTSYISFAKFDVNNIKNRELGL